MELRTQDDIIPFRQHNADDDSISLPDLATLHPRITDMELDYMFQSLTSGADSRTVPRVFGNGDPRIVPTPVTAERLAQLQAQVSTPEHDPEGQSVAVTFEEPTPAPAPQHDPESQSVAVAFEEPTPAPAPGHDPKSEPVAEQPNQAPASGRKPSSVAFAKQPARASTSDRKLSRKPVAKQPAWASTFGRKPTSKPAANQPPRATPSGHNPEIEYVTEWLEGVEAVPASEHSPEVEPVADTSKQPPQVSATPRPAARGRYGPRPAPDTGFKAFGSRCKEKFLRGAKCLFAGVYLTVCVLICPTQP